MREVPTALSAALSTRYRIERELGAGGMATVYLARDLKHKRDVAIKVLRAEVASAVGVDRFLAEIKTTGHLKHSGSADALLFYVMPFIDGESLRARLLPAGRWTSSVPFSRSIQGASSGESMKRVGAGD